MKQKQVKASPKVAKQAKATNKATPAKKARVEIESDDEEEEVVPQKIVAKKPSGKKAAKVQKKFKEPSEDEEEQEDDEVVPEKIVGKKSLKKVSKLQETVEEPSDEEVDENEDQEDDEVEEEDEEACEDEGDDEDEEQEQDEEVEAEDDDDDDEAPSEETIVKEEPTIPSQVKSGPIPQTVPFNRVIHVTKLPKKCNKINIIEAFAKYGAIEQVHILTTTGGTVADVAFKTEKAAIAASADDKKLKVLDSPAWIKIKKEKNFNDRDRSVHVKYVKTGTTEEELRQHFESCGEIEAVKLFIRHGETKFAFVTFKDKSAIPEALKLHNSVLNGVHINVTANAEKQSIPARLSDERLTILMKNTHGFENIDVAKLETIFSKCGEIAILDVVCKKNVLAFITFKTEKAVEKALALNGKTEEEIDLDLELYDPVKRWTCIHVSNLPKGCTEEDLTNVFSKAGEIANITFKKGYAIVRFTDCEGYCKSFLYNETFIKGQCIFVEPHSARKSMIVKSFQNRGFKRPAQNGFNVFKPKKAKVF